MYSKYFPGVICQNYNIIQLSTPDGYDYCRIKRGIYGLKWADHLAWDKLIKHLKPHGCFLSPHASNICINHTMLDIE